MAGPLLLYYLSVFNECGLGTVVCFDSKLRCFFGALLRDSFGACSGMVRREQVNRPERTRGRTGDLVARVANFRNVGRMRSGGKGRMLDRDSLPRQGRIEFARPMYLNQDQGDGRMGQDLGFEPGWNGLEDISGSWRIRSVPSCPGPSSHLHHPGSFS